MWFRHPKPFLQKPVAMQMVKRTMAPAADANNIVINRPEHEAAAGWQADPTPAPASSLRFNIKYALRDDLAVLQEHIAFKLACRRKQESSRSIVKRAGRSLLGLLLIAAIFHTFGLVHALFTGAVLLLLSAPVTLSLWVLLIGLPMFIIKRWNSPGCDLSIDAHGVTRVSTRGMLNKPWQQLVESRAYSRSYLLVFKKGAIPIPYRCLSAGELVRMRALLSQVKV